LAARFAIFSSRVRRDKRSDTRKGTGSDVFCQGSKAKLKRALHAVKRSALRREGTMNIKTREKKYE